MRVKYCENNLSFPYFWQSVCTDWHSLIDALELRMWNIFNNCMLHCCISYSLLEKHIVDTHIKRVDPVKHPCPVCGKTFPKRGLDTHLLIHQGLYQFHCTDCSYKSKCRTQFNGYYNSIRFIFAVLQQTIGGMFKLQLHTHYCYCTCLFCRTFVQSTRPQG